MDNRKIFNLIDERKEELFELLTSFIKIDSQSFISYGKERELAENIHKLCCELGFESDIYSPVELEGFINHPDYLPGRGLEDRYNVTAVWKGEKDENELMLMAHTDTVEVGDMKSWDKDPFSGKIENGRIYGRGASDDKYALAAVLFVMRLLKDSGFKPKSNLLFAAYCDEEYGGSHGAMAAVMKHPTKRIVSLDAEEGQIWHCGSGGQEVKYIYRTENSADSAKACAMAIPLILEVMDKFGANRRNELNNNKFYRGTNIPDTSLRYMGVRAGNNGTDLGTGEVYFVYYTDKTKDEIYKEFKELEKELNERLLPMGISGAFVPATRFFHYVHCEPDSEDVMLMAKAVKEATGQESLICGSCLSDLSVISKYGSDRAFAYGVGRDFCREGGAHQPNEYIECDELVRFAKAIAVFIIDVLS